MARLSCGIVGLPNVGKSTLFNALTRGGAASSNYPFCTIDPNVGIVNVPDARLPVLAELSKSQKIIYATMEFVDIAGLVEGASQGEGLGNQFLANIRETTAIIHVVRCFEAHEVIHVAGRIDPVHDAEVINVELRLADLQSVEKILDKVAKQAKADKEARILQGLLERVRDHLDANRPVRTMELSDDEWKRLKPYPFLTSKRVLYVANVSENSLPSMENDQVAQLRSYAEAEGNWVIPLCCKLEEELAQLDEQEQTEMLQSMGLGETGLSRLIHASFEMLGLITFLTTGEPETRAWTIVKGTKAAVAAGTIHSDLEHGFIRAEVIPYGSFVQRKGRVAAREVGEARSEGKEYVVRDGDVILFFHH
jgi:ribosome-binding ATPase